MKFPVDLLSDGKSLTLAENSKEMRKYKYKNNTIAKISNFKIKIKNLLVFDK